ncbi:MAG: endolytic transglycosylase MltG [Bacteroidetes bacterium HGW-Bacteroidetes-6]|jgi:UPF0755 protein|nr:MAG: endolytic transglycosylase MltG [Bacteroidetes bacterium HGW-Bacteroidetes-6]
MKKIILIILTILLILGAGGAWYVYNKAFSPNVNLEGKNEQVIYLPTGSTMQNLMDTIEKYNLLQDKSSFEMLAKYKHLDKKLKSGRYVIVAGMSNNAMVNMFISGRQTPVTITFNNIRTREDFVEKIGPKLECGKEALLEVLNSDSIAKKYGLTRENLMVIFIPNTYEIYWNTSAADFIDKMYAEYEKFWTSERRKKAEAIGLKPEEVSILASIVQGETNKIDEMGEIAGVYINRIRKGWKLEACPTVIFAIGDFTKTRVLKKDLEIESPYNTYRNEGLPPGPINLPNASTIDQVLNYSKHDYMFFSAREDFSGYHNFAVTSKQHAANARKYQAAYREWQKKKKKEEQANN